ncbi:MAG: KTSC domain-containing protein [Nocardioides sp.]|uniref:KTSC domain-containing protein n=1 Tax=Nocardioides sp. TaxID=35761 RepID=UPI0039E6CE8E
MNMVLVVSDNVAFVGYGHATRTLRVKFHSGGTYDYYDVSVFLYEAMLLPHPWHRVGRQFLAHRYRRIAA